MSGNFDDLDETHDNIDSQNSVFSPESKQDFIFEELLQELYIVLLNTKIGKDYLDFTINLLLNYNLDSKNVLEIMSKSSQNFNCTQV